MYKLSTKKTDEGPIVMCPKDEREVNAYHSCFTCIWKYVYNKAENYVMCDWRKR